MKIHRSLIEKLVASEFIKPILDDGYMAFDNSGFSQWLQCRTKGFINTGLRRIPSAGQTPLIFGSAVHDGIAERLRGKSNEEALKVALNVARTRNLDAYLDDRRNTRTLVDLLTSYFLNCDCTDSWIRPVQVGGEAVVEKGFEFELGTRHVDGLRYFLGTTFRFAWKGKLDVLAREQGDLWIYDHKTTSVMGEKFIDDKIRSAQMLGYSWAGSRFAGVFNEIVRGVKINALAQRAKGFEFKLFTIPYTPQQINDWADETIEAMVELVRFLDKMLSWLYDSSEQWFELCPNRDACVSKYGRCAYFDACNSVPVMLPRVLFDDAQFVQNEWDPLAE